MTTLYGRLRLADGTPDVGQVSVNLAESTALDRETGVVKVTAAPVVTELDSSGAFAVDLIGADDPGWRAPVEHIIVVSTDGLSGSVTADRVRGESVDLADLLRPAR